MFGSFLTPHQYFLTGGTQEGKWPSKADSGFNLLLDRLSSRTPLMNRDPFENRSMMVKAKKYPPF